eukprot:10622671-Heterocapsa_arctica.AAC.1
MYNPRETLLLHRFDAVDGLLLQALRLLQQHVLLVVVLHDAGLILVRELAVLLLERLIGSSAVCRSSQAPSPCRSALFAA